MPERQVSLQELASKLASYIHDVKNGAMHNGPSNTSGSRLRVKTRPFL